MLVHTRLLCCVAEFHFMCVWQAHVVVVVAHRRKTIRLNSKQFLCMTMPAGAMLKIKSATIGSGNVIRLFLKHSCWRVFGIISQNHRSFNKWIMHIGNSFAILPTPVAPSCVPKGCGKTFNWTSSKLSSIKCRATVSTRLKSVILDCNLAQKPLATVDFPGSFKLFPWFCLFVKIEAYSNTILVDFYISLFCPKAIFSNFQNNRPQSPFYMNCAISHTPHTPHYTQST